LVFKRRDPRNLAQRTSHFFYPQGGWRRAISYVWHRLRRLPDPPHRIARGIACGVFVCFSPLFGFHFIYAALLALLIRGNVLASMLATFVGNPITFPFMAALSLTVGEWMLGVTSAVPLPQVFTAFSQAAAQLWHNLASLVTDDVAHWDRLVRFFYGVFLPYMVGSFLPGLIAGAIAYYLSYPVITVHQKRRAKKLAARAQSRMGMRRSGGAARPVRKG
jgi:uncharacterized protein (DUF2062 family)